MYMYISYMHVYSNTRCPWMLTCTCTCVMHMSYGLQCTMTGDLGCQNTLTCHQIVWSSYQTFLYEKTQSFVYFVLCTCTLILKSVYFCLYHVSNCTWMLSFFKVNVNKEKSYLPQMQPEPPWPRGGTLHSACRQP